MASEEREVSGFTAVDLGTVGTVFIELGERDSLRIEAEDNFMQYIETEVRDGVLHLETRAGVNILPTQPLFYYLTVEELDGIIVSGLGNVEAPEINTGRFSVSITGGGNIDMEKLEGDQLEVDISGLGDLNIDDGAVGEQSITISGGGNYKADEMASDKAQVDISGLGSATLWATDQLTVDISGGGSVRYVGNPSVDQNVSGLGRVERIGE